MPVLKNGSKGKPVETLQTALNKAGAKPKLNVDGKFGPLTEAAVRAFQKKNKLGVDGKVGDDTSYALGLIKRPKSLDWPLGEMDVFYGKVIEARRFNSAKSKEAIAFLKAAQDDVQNLKKALAVKEAKVVQAEKSLETIFSGQIKTFNSLEKIRVKCEKLTNAAEIKALHNKGEAILEAWKGQAIREGWYDHIKDLGDTLEQIKAYSLGLRSIKKRGSL